MREIIQIQVGQCGNQLGSTFWEVIGKEHGIDNDGNYNHFNSGTSNKDVHYRETSGGKYIPRACLVDLEPGVLASIKVSSQGRLFHPNNYIYGSSGAGNIWAKGYYTDGNDLIDSVMEVARKEVEECDSLQGFQIVHSLGGGTGSGLGCLIMSKLRELFPEKLMSTYSVLPSENSSNVVEHYNTILTLHQLIENADFVACFDNLALKEICKRHLNISEPDHPHLNTLIAHVMSGVTCGTRFPGELNGDLRRTAVNLTPFPRLHFFTPSFAPLQLLPKFSTGHFSSFNPSQLTSQLFDLNNIMIKTTKNKYLAAACSFRGRMSAQQVELSLTNFRLKNADMFVPWIPNNIITTLCNTPPSGMDLAATMIGNYAGITDVFNRIAVQFKKMFSRRAFVQSYNAEGMEDLEFTEAESNLYDLIAEYNQYTKVEEDVETDLDEKDMSIDLSSPFKT